MVVNGATTMKRQRRYTTMRYALCSLNENDRRTIVPGLRHLAHIEAQRALSLLGALLAKRQDKPWLCLVAVPLAMTASTVSLQLWLLPPLAVLAWYWGSKDDPLLWLLGVMEACFSVVWAFLGAYTLAALPNDRIIVGAGWICYALVVALSGGVNRWRFQRKYGW
jgi:hypothetical protein